MRFLVFVFLAVLAAAMPAMAKTVDSPLNLEKVQVELEAESRKILKDLNETQAAALAQISTGFGMLRAVNIVRKDVSGTVEKCGAANEGLKAEITGRFKEWDSKVSPLLKSNEAKMKESINGGIFKEPAKIKAYLDKVDAYAIRADKKIDKQILTDEGSCKSLLESLDDTEDTVTDILSKMEWPESPPAEQKKKD